MQKRNNLVSLLHFVFIRNALYRTSRTINRVPHNITPAELILQLLSFLSSVLRLPQVTTLTNLFTQLDVSHTVLSSSAITIIYEKSLPILQNRIKFQAYRSWLLLQLT